MQCPNSMPCAHVPNCPQNEASITSGQMYRQSTSEAGICSAAPLVRLLACCGLPACKLASLSCLFGWNCTQHRQPSLLNSQQTLCVQMWPVLLALPGSLKASTCDAICTL